MILTLWTSEESRRYPDSFGEVASLLFNSKSGLVALLLANIRRVVVESAAGMLFFGILQSHFPASNEQEYHLLAIFGSGVKRYVTVLLLFFFLSIDSNTMISFRCK